jgi:hypothetical protein
MSIQERQRQEKIDSANDRRAIAEKRKALVGATDALTSALNEHAKNPCGVGRPGGCMRSQEELPPRSVRANMRKREVDRATFWDLDPEEMCEACAAHWYLSAALARLIGANNKDWVLSAIADRDAGITRPAVAWKPPTAAEALAKVLPLAEAYLNHAPGHPGQAVLEDARAALLAAAVRP